MAEHKLQAELDWFDTDDLPAILEYIDHFVRAFAHDGLHTGGITIESYEGPTSDGELTFQLCTAVDLEDVPTLIEAVLNEFCLDGPNTGGISLSSVEFS